MKIDWGWMILESQSNTGMCYLELKLGQWRWTSFELRAIENPKYLPVSICATCHIPMDFISPQHWDRTFCPRCMMASRARYRQVEMIPFYLADNAGGSVAKLRCAECGADYSASKIVACGNCAVPRETGIRLERYGKLVWQWRRIV